MGGLTPRRRASRVTHSRIVRSSPMMEWHPLDRIRTRPAKIHNPEATAAKSRTDNYHDKLKSSAESRSRPGYVEGMRRRRKNSVPSLRATS